MDVKWTPQQEEAVFAPVSNILVTAAAGAGKTQVLTGRILNRILSGSDVTRMLIVTFTNAAAAEMKSRIAKALSEEIIKNPENEHIRRQAVLLPLASIQTIHSFCLDVIKNNFFRADISPDFKIADEAECKIMKSEAVQEAFDALYEEGDEDFFAFTDSFSNAKNDLKAEEMVLNLFTFAESMPFPDEWLLKQCELYENITEDNFEDFYFVGIITEKIREMLTEGKYRLEDAIKQCEEDAIFKPYCEMFEKDISKIDALLEAESWNELSAMAQEFSFDRKVTVRGGDEEFKKSVDKVRSDVKEDVLKALLYAAYDKEQNVYLMKQTAPALRGLVKSTLKFQECFSDMKKEKNLVDFSDIEHICIKLLSYDDIAMERKNFFEEIYVDEYQDSNMAQDYIFRAISRESLGSPNVFMVGDVKQSIYGFRQTSPKLFLDKKDSYSFGDNKNRKIVLSKNFRSCEGVINYINTVFESIMSREVGGVDYDEEEKLVFAASYPERSNAAEINILELEGDEDAIRSEAVFISEKILGLVGKEKIYDIKAGLEREIRFSDIAILMRSPKRCIPVFESVFKEFDIPLFVDYDDGYFDTTEAKTILSLLNVIDNPENDIPLISVLRSPIGGFNEDELAKIRLYEKKESFFTALEKCAEGGGRLGEKCLEFNKKLNRFRVYSKYMPCHTLIDTVVSETGYYDAVYAMPGATERADNIKLLIEQARNYENSSYRGLYNFINYINNVKEKSGNLGASKSVGDSAKVVRIMSIHKSKGLEFPVVFLARCSKKMNTRDLSGDLILHGDCGIGISYVEKKKRIFSDTMLKMAAKIKKEQEDLSEEIRILYVALTRAKEKLFITATVKDSAKSMEKWGGMARLVERRFPLKASSYIDYLMAVALYCKNTQINGAAINILPAGEMEEMAEKNENIYTLNSEFDEKIYKALSYNYPHDDLWQIPSKVTVTELKRMQEKETDDAVLLYMNIDIKVPEFIEAEKITPARKGQLMHFVMQSIPLDCTDVEGVKNYVSELGRKNILTAEETLAIECEKIAAFFETPLGQRMKNADKVMREEPFAMAVPASMVTGKSDDFNQKIMVQGIIDCYFFEGDNIILIDYKTDRNCSKDSIINNYKKQIDIYAEALEKKYFKKIYEKFIYLFNNSGIIEIN